MTNEAAKSEYVSRAIRALRSIRIEGVVEFVDLLLDAKERGGRVFIVGNGGSATTASHMATDLGVGSQRVGAGIRVYSLTDNVGALTAMGNDVSFKGIFAAQLRLLGERGDLLVVISASGNSSNLVEAALTARHLEMKVVGITGFTGGKIKDCADISVHVETEVGDYGPAEDAHLVINHMVTELVRERVGLAVDIGELNE